MVYKAHMKNGAKYVAASSTLKLPKSNSHYINILFKKLSIFFIKPCLTKLADILGLVSIMPTSVDP